MLMLSPKLGFVQLKNLYDNLYLALFGRKFIKIAIWYDSVYSVSRPKFEVWLNRRY